MKRAVLIAAAIVIVAAAIFLVFQVVIGGAQQSQSAAATPTAPAQAEDVIWASGKLVPAQWGGLSAATGGTVKTIHVAEGDRVQSGDLLLELSSTTLQSQVDVAAAALGEAEAARDKLLAGATPQQIAAAQADVALAQANLESAKAGVESARRTAAAAERQVGVAQAQYDELASRPTPAEKVAALREIDLARAAVKLAQQAYNRVAGDPNIAMLPEALALEQATLRLNSAQAAYDVATQGATGQQLAVAKAQIGTAQAQAQVAASQVPTAESAVEAAQAQLTKADAALQALRAGATAEDKALAERRIASARAALAGAQAQLQDAQIRAPFAGQVGTIGVRPGELAVPGQVLLMLGSTDKLRVETTDLRETDVTRLVTGMPAEVTFDALPNQKFQGTVSRIASMSTTEKGSTNYTLLVDVPDLHPALRWGMTAFVNLRGQK